MATRVPKEPPEIRILNPYFIQEAAFTLIGLPFNNGLMGRGVRLLGGEGQDLEGERVAVLGERGSMGGRPILALGLISSGGLSPTLPHPSTEHSCFLSFQNIPTLGSVAVTMALHGCDEVAVAGFGYDMNTPNAPLHYYETVRMAAIKEVRPGQGAVWGRGI